MIFIPAPTIFHCSIVRVGTLFMIRQTQYLYNIIVLLCFSALDFTDYFFMFLFLFDRHLQFCSECHRSQSSLNKPVKDNIKTGSSGGG